MSFLDLVVDQRDVIPDVIDEVGDSMLSIVNIVAIILVIGIIVAAVILIRMKGKGTNKPADQPGSQNLTKDRASGKTDDKAGQA